MNEYGQPLSYDVVADCLTGDLVQPGLVGLHVFAAAAAGHTSTVSVVVTGAVPSALTVRVTVYVPGAP